MNINLVYVDVDVDVDVDVLYYVCVCVSIAYFNEINRQKYDGDIKRALILFISSFDLYQNYICSLRMFLVILLWVSQM